MRALIVGGAGFIGRHLAVSLNAKGADTTVFDINDPDWLADADIFDPAQTSNVSFICGNVGDPMALRAAFSHVRPSLVYYLAAEAMVREAARRPAEACRSMVHGLTHCLNEVRAQADIQRFVFVSSSMVYGDFVDDEAHEDHFTQPLNVYGGLKLAGEAITRGLLAGTNVECVVVRPTGVYGPGERHPRVVRNVCEAALRRSPIELVNPDANHIDFTYIDDLVSGLHLAGSVPGAAGQTFNLAYGQGRSLGDLARIVLSIEPGSMVVARKTVDQETPRRGTLSCARARRILGFRPQISLENGVLAYLQHLTSRRAGAA